VHSARRACVPHSRACACVRASMPRVCVHMCHTRGYLPGIPGGARRASSRQIFRKHYCATRCHRWGIKCCFGSSAMLISMLVFPGFVCRGAAKHCGGLCVSMFEFPPLCCEHTAQPDTLASLLKLETDPLPCPPTPGAEGAALLVECVCRGRRSRDVF
jgi:hypothetical protein